MNTVSFINEILTFYYDSEGNYIGPPSRKYLANGEAIDIDDHAEEMGVSLPDSE